MATKRKQYPKVSAAEKYAELERLGQERPVCECHGEPMRWLGDARCRAGGSWECRIRRREDALRYQLTDRGKEKCRRNNARRVSAFGERIFVPEGFQETARRMRDQRKQEEL